MEVRALEEVSVSSRDAVREAELHTHGLGPSRVQCAREQALLPYWSPHLSPTIRPYRWAGFPGPRRRSPVSGERGPNNFMCRCRRAR